MQLPYPPNTGERIRNFNLLRVLGKTQDIYLLSLIQCPTERDFIPDIEKHCRQVDTVLLRKYSKLKHLPSVVGRIMSGQPMDMKFYFLPEMVERIEEALSTHVFDIIQIEHSYMASYLEVIPANIVSKKVLTFIDVESARLHKMLKMEKNPYWRLRYLLNWLPMRRWEARIATIVDKCITTSHVDKERLQSINKFASVSIIPNGVDIHSPNLCLFSCNRRPSCLLVRYSIPRMWMPRRISLVRCFHTLCGRYRMPHSSS